MHSNYVADVVCAVAILKYFIYHFYESLCSTRMSCPGQAWLGLGLRGFSSAVDGWMDDDDENQGTANSS